jgi:hypothetical protein
VQAGLQRSEQKGQEEDVRRGPHELTRGQQGAFPHSVHWNLKLD